MLINIKKSKEKIMVNVPIAFGDRELEDELFWNDLYLIPDIIEGDKKVFYLIDTAYNRVYWGYVGQKTAQREDDKEIEKEILKNFLGED